MHPGEKLKLAASDWNQRRPAWVHGPVEAALVLAAAVGLLALVWVLLHPLALLLAAITIAQAAAPLVARLHRWLPRAAAVLLVYLVALLALVGLGLVAAPLLLEQVEALLARGSELLARPGTMAERVEEATGLTPLEAAQAGGGVLGNLVLKAPLMAARVLVEIVAVVILSLYWLLAAPRFLPFVLSLVPPARQPELASVLREMGEAMGSYFRVFLLSALLLGAMVYAGLLILGVEYPGALALLAGLGELVPLIGPLLAGVPAVGLAMLESPGTGLIVLGFYLVVQQLEDNVVVPLLVRDQTDLAPALALFAVLVGAALLGLLGVFVAIPVAAALRVLTIRVLAPAIRRRTGADQTAEAVGEQPAWSGQAPEDTPPTVRKRS